MWSGNTKILRGHNFKLYVLPGETDVYLFHPASWKSLHEIKDVPGRSVMWLLCKGMGWSRQRSNLEVKLKFSQLKDWIYYCFIIIFCFNDSVVNFMHRTKIFSEYIGISGGF